MLCPFIMRDENRDVVAGTPTVVTSDGDTLTPSAGSNGWWTVDADAGVGVTATLTGADPLDFVVPLRDPSLLSSQSTVDVVDGNVDTLLTRATELRLAQLDAANLPAGVAAAIAAAAEAAANSAAAAIRLALGMEAADLDEQLDGLATSDDLDEAVEEIVDAIPNAARPSYVRVNQATHDTDDLAIGTIAPGAIVTAYLKPDETVTVGPSEPATSVGAWYLDLPPDGLWRLHADGADYDHTDVEVQT